jgi:hypothetical protein
MVLLTLFTSIALAQDSQSVQGGKPIGEWAIGFFVLLLIVVVAIKYRNSDKKTYLWGKKKAEKKRLRRLERNTAFERLLKENRFKEADRRLELRDDQLPVIRDKYIDYIGRLAYKEYVEGRLTMLNPDLKRDIQVLENINRRIIKEGGDINETTATGNKILTKWKKRQAEYFQMISQEVFREYDNGYLKNIGLLEACKDLDYIFERIDSLE